MTTIAWRGDILATDTKMVYDEMKLLCNKLHPIDGVGCFGLAGDLTAEVHFLNWYKAGAKYGDWVHSKANKGFEGLLLDEWGACYLFPGGPESTRIEDQFYAVGSGGKIARAFMHAGFTALQAIKATSEIDNNTNSIVDWYNCKTGKITRGRHVKTAVS
jgi:hypothetical protein